MNKDCQQFEERVQRLLDSRIDPETDESICAHSSVCESCYESLMAFSLLHTNYLKDSDSMKIKLDSLGLHEALYRKKDEQPNRKHLFAVAASIAALILIFAALILSEPNRPVAASRLDTAVTISELPLNNVSLESIVRIKKSLEQNEIYFSLSELPGLRPFKALAFCLDWFHQSWIATPVPQNSPTAEIPELGLQFELELKQHANFRKFACVS